jgi:hypothetical protein
MDPADPQSLQEAIVEADLESAMSETAEGSEKESQQAAAKYSVCQVVYARDQDGVLYESVIRR